MKKGWLLTVLLCGALLFSSCAELSSLLMPESSAEEEPSSSSSKQDARVNVRKPIIKPAEVFNAIDFEYGRNNDTVGWLRIPETDITDPVMQANDNYYYLRRTEQLENNVYGCYFADYECSFGTRDQLSPNTVIYGHSDLKDNPDGPKFSQLFRFLQEPFAKSTPYVYFATAGDYMVWEVFAVFRTGTEMRYIDVNLNEASLGALIAEAKQKSVWNYDVPVSGTDKILTLSTCTERGDASDGQRLVVMSRLIPADAELKKQASITAPGPGAASVPEVPEDGVEQ